MLIPQTLEGFIGTQLIYTYENGWEYEIYVKTADIIDYRIHSGVVAGHWTKDQKAYMDVLAPGIFKLSWTEPTGTCVSLVYMMADMRTHGTIFYPKWVREHPEVMQCYQNEHMQEMEDARNKYENFPFYIVSEFSKITFMANWGPNNEKVISKAPYPGMCDDIRSGKLAPN